MSSFQLQNADVLSRLKPFGISFEKSLSDLIKGIRSHSKESAESLSKFLENAIVECKNELNTTDLETKATAVLKLTYLEMYGFEMSWCNFQILEVMSSSKIQQKRIGYLAVMQSFKNEKDLLVLATNQFKKDLNSPNHVEIGLALSGIATIVTPNLAQDITDDVVVKLNHSTSYIRKKAILTLFKIFVKYPESLKSNFDRVIRKLDDTDTTVVNATITIICEISKTNPEIFVNYLPKFFQILEETKNNWLTIRILKLFQSLSRVEPRMKKKICPTIVKLMLKTQASSLVYECINCIVGGGMLSSESSRDKETALLCIEQLMSFFTTQDPNLKYVGLIALINIISKYPSLIHKSPGISQMILDSIKDKDFIMKRKALEICDLLVTEKNMVDIVKILLIQAVPEEDVTFPKGFIFELTSKLIQVCRNDNYSRIPNFRWYIAVLSDLINITLLQSKASTSALVSKDIVSSRKIATLIGEEFKNLATKVPSIREHILRQVILPSLEDVAVFETCPDLLRDFFWTIGEYVSYLCESDESDVDSEEEYDENEGELNNKSLKGLGQLINLYNNLVNYRVDVLCSHENGLLFPVSKRLVEITDSGAITVIIQSLVKVFSEMVVQYLKSYSINGRISKKNMSDLSYFLYKLIVFFENWENHGDYEVQETVLSWLEFLRICLEAMTKGAGININDLEKSEIEYYKAKAAEAQYSDTESESHSEVEVDYSSAVSYSSSESEEEIMDDIESHESMPHNLNEDLPEENKSSLPGSLNSDDVIQDTDTLLSVPQLISVVLPSFFNSYQLLPVAPDAQSKIVLPEDIDLKVDDFDYGLMHSTTEHDHSIDSDNDSYILYLSDDDKNVASNTDALISLESDSEKIAKRKLRSDKLKDDPYYISSENNLNKSHVKHKSKSKTIDLLNGLSQGQLRSPSAFEKSTKSTKKKHRKLKKEKVLILSESTIEGAPHVQKEASVEATSDKNALKIEKGNFDDFYGMEEKNLERISASAPSNTSDTEINLDDIRKELEESELAKKKSKRSKTKERESTKTGKTKNRNSKSKDRTKKSKEQNSSTNTAVEGADTGSSETVHVVLDKKKVKKRLAVIDDI